ncbi:MAG: hypothetical protein KGI54_13255 [Pseudomonadota bacterium]|nr:hypothetical protein [Pseudomonadota bacterium]
MSPAVEVILLAVALITFILGAFEVPARINWIAAGLAFWVTVPLILAVEAAGN